MTHIGLGKLVRHVGFEHLPHARVSLLTVQRQVDVSVRATVPDVTGEDVNLVLLHCNHGITPSIYESQNQQFFSTDTWKITH